MSSVSSKTLRSRAVERLAPHGSEGIRAGLSGVVDLDALKNERYDDVLDSVNDRLTMAQYSLVSMLVAGIYFGLLMGTWLVTVSTWPLILRWALPVGLVTIYAVYSSYQTIREIRALSEARILLRTIADQPDPTTETQ